MTRHAHRYWLRFPGANTWRCWESDEYHPYGVAVEAARELRCTLPIAIEVRGDKDGHVQRVTVLELATFGFANSGTVEEIQA
jgi:hypothetical protein